MERGGYLGRDPSNSFVRIARQSNTVSGVTTTFTFSSGYEVGYIDVYLNGSKLVVGSEYTALDAQTITLTPPAQGGDTIEFVAYKSFNLIQTKITASDGDFTVGSNIIAVGTIEGNQFIGDGTNLTGIVTNITAGDNISVDSSTGSVTITGLANTANVVSDSLVVSGVSTLGNVVSDSLVVSGVSTLGQVQGISGVSTTFVSAVGIQSGGVTIGAGITQLNFVGTGNTFKVDGTTVDISIESGGGAGLSTTGVSTGFVFSNPNAITTSIELTEPGMNYGMFGPITISGVGVTVTVGAGNSFTIV